MTGKFKAGDIIQFINVKVDEDESTFFIPSDVYNTEEDGISEELIIHGNTRFYNNINEGEVITIYKSFYIVKYIDELEKEVQLGFLESDLEFYEINLSNDNPDLEELYNLLREVKKL